MPMVTNDVKFKHFVISSDNSFTTLTLKATDYFKVEELRLLPHDDEHIISKSKKIAQRLRIVT